MSAGLVVEATGQPGDMPRIGFHSSHEQCSPSDLLRAAQHAEAAGFEALMCSDHFAPWSERQGHSGHAWAWLGAALQSTTLDWAVVTAPGQRYHPAVTAQAIATIAEMFPGRFTAALGSGEAINEHITGGGWPAKPVRDERLVESATVIRALLDGDQVDHRGLITVDRARLWSLPQIPPNLFGAAVSTATARRVGSWADGMITIWQPAAQLTEVIDAFRDGGGAGKPVYVQAHVCYAETDARALEIAYDQWRHDVLAPEMLWDVDDVRTFDELSRDVEATSVGDSVLSSSDPSRHAERLSEAFELGVDTVFVHHVGQEQRSFIDWFAERVIPAVDR